MKGNIVGTYEDLPPYLRITMDLIDTGYTIEQAAQELNLTVNTVHAYLHKIQEIIQENHNTSAYDQMTRQQQNIAHLLIEDLTVDEIARRLGTTRQNVHTQISNMRRKIRKSTGNEVHPAWRMRDWFRKILKGD